MEKRLETFLDDNGTEFTVEVEYPTWYFVYVLYLNLTPIYVGCTVNIKQRMVSHKTKGKIFDSYKVIYKSTVRKNSLNMEKCCIHFLKHINPQSLNYVKGLYKSENVSVKMKGVVNA